MKDETLYLKIDRNIRIHSTPVSLKDVATVLCREKTVENRAKTIKLPTSEIRGPGRYVFSVTDVIETVQQEMPGLEVCNLGESDFILTMEKTKKTSEAWSWCKTVLVSFLSFFGAAFSIMAFNNDIGITNLFGQLYRQFTGEASDGFTVLEVTYSLGVGIGILVYFNHFSRKKRTTDPSPLEVEMRTYEDEVDTTLIEAEGREMKGKGQEG